jgi:hypothetical protein
MMMSIEVTPELTGAVKWLRANVTDGKFNTPQFAAAILAALPEEVTNPKPELPTTDDRYVTAAGSLVTLVQGHWYWGLSDVLIEHPHELAPLTRLVPEKPPVTAQELKDIWQESREWPWQNVADYVNGDRA